MKTVILNKNKSSQNGSNQYIGNDPRRVFPVHKNDTYISEKQKALSIFFHLRAALGKNSKLHPQIVIILFDSFLVFITPIYKISNFLWKHLKHVWFWFKNIIILELSSNKNEEFISSHLLVVFYKKLTSTWFFITKIRGYFTQEEKMYMTKYSAFLILSKPELLWKLRLKFKNCSRNFSTT